MMCGCDSARYACRRGRTTRLMLCAFLALAVFTVPPLAPQQPKPAAGAGPQERAAALELLEGAAASVSAAPAEMQPDLLLRIAEVWQKADRRKAVELVEQALNASVALPDDWPHHWRLQFQSRALAELAKLDLEKAIERLPILPQGERGPNYVAQALDEILGQLLEKRDYDRAIELTRRFGRGNLGVTGKLLKALPKEDTRRGEVLAVAARAVQNPMCQCAGFFKTYRDEIPAQTYRSMLGTLAHSILDMDEEETVSLTQVIATSKGTVTLDTTKDIQLFELIPVLRDTDPELAKRILDKRPKLAQLIEEYPDGMESVWKTGKGGTIFYGIGGSPAGSVERAQEVQEQTLSVHQEAETRHLAESDPEKALALARSSPSDRVKLLAVHSIVQGFDDHQEAVASLLPGCFDVLSEVKEESSQVADAWEMLAQGAHEAGLPDLAWKALEKGLGVAAALHKKNEDPETGEGAPRFLWNSTGSFRRLFYRAAKLEGPAAKGLLDQYRAADILLVARIEIAAALLDLPKPHYQVSSSPRGQTRR